MGLDRMSRRQQRGAGLRPGMEGSPPISDALGKLAETISSVDLPCPACAESAAQAYTMRNRMAIVRCSSCGCLYVRPRPRESELAAIYERFPQLSNGREGQTQDDPEDGRWEATDRLRRLQTLAPSGRLLDLGCGRGDFLAAASVAFDVQGVDLVPRPRREAEGLPTFRGSLEEARFPDATFDVVTAVEVMEHLFDPRRTLGEIHRILKPRGIFLFQTGDADSLRARLNPETWTYLQPPIHLNVFSRSSLRRLATEFRFRPIQSWSFGRAPTKMPIVLRIWKAAPLRRFWDVAASVGILGQMHAWQKEA
jgi:SAM-dependent methyltransferase